MLFLFYLVLTHTYQIEGIVISKEKSSLMIETTDKKRCSTVSPSLPIADYKLGDKVIIYYKGSLLETYPCKIKDVIKIEKVN